MADDAGVRPLYFEWLQSGTELRGGDGRTHVWDRAAENAGLQVVCMTGDAQAAGWHALAADARVWLVDVWGEDNLFDLAVQAGLVPKP